MSLTVPEDAASLLEQFVHDVANTPAEITHLLEEIQAKDLQIYAFKEEINKRDLALQRWVRANGGHAANPKEEPFSRTINDCYDKCEILQAEKCGLSEKALIVLERQIKRLDTGLKHLSHSGDFPADWQGPTLLGGSGNVTGVNTPLSAAGGAVPTGPLQAVSGNAGAAGPPNIANAAQMRMAVQAAARPPASGTQTPTAMPRGQREGSTEANKRRRLNTSLGQLPAASSNLRQSSLGPGTPKAGTPAPATGSSRAGSAQPNRPALAAQKKNPSQVGATRKPPPPQGASSARKRDRVRNGGNKKGGDRRRQLKSDRATPSTNASASSDSEGSASPTPSSLPRSQADGAQDQKRSTAGDGTTKTEDDAEGEEDEEDGDDDAIYCFCQRRSYGEMIGCDNDDCQYQWFHFGCVGMKEQPSGEWLCPSCRKLPRSQIVKSE